MSILPDVVSNLVGAVQVDPSTVEWTNPYNVTFTFRQQQPRHYLGKEPSDSVVLVSFPCSISSDLGYAALLQRTDGAGPVRIYNADITQQSNQTLASFYHEIRQDNPIFNF